MKGFLMDLNKEAIEWVLQKWLVGGNVYNATDIQDCAKEIIKAARSEIGHKVCLDDLRKGDLVEMKNHPANIEQGEVLYVFNGSESPCPYTFALIKDVIGRIHTLQPHMTGTTLAGRRE
jgi:hypothetical protein